MSARSLYADLGIDLPDRDGANVQVRCFTASDTHRREDRRPSCSVNVETGAYNCFGCEAKGGPFDAALALGKSSAEAMELLRRHGLAGENCDQPAPRSTSKPAARLSEAEVERYRRALTTENGALGRLAELRGWTAEAIEALGLGLDRDRVVFPIREADGSLVNLLRFAPDPERCNGAPKLLAESGCPRDLFPAPQTIHGGLLWIVEGEPDAVAGRSLGLPAVAIPGVRGWRSEWAVRFAGRRVVVCLDCDRQGREAAQRIARDLVDHTTEVRVLDLDPERDDGYDLGDVALEAAGNGKGRADVRDRLERTAAAIKPLEAPEPEDGAELLEALAAFVRRFVVVTRAQAVVVALWIVHTHAIAAAEATPYLAITSAEKRSGKTRLLEVLGLVVARALVTSNISDAALFRSIAAEQPTLLFDEIDAIFGPKARDREDLRGMVNAGHRRGAEVRRVGGANRDKLERFAVFCPKALAGIGRLPETVADRALPIRLERRGPGEHVERFRRREVEPDAAVLRERIERFVGESLDTLESARPDLPPDLDDRAQDGAEPLLAIADLAAGEWPLRARAAMLELLAGREADDGSHRVRLLADLRAVFDRTGADRLATVDLLERLSAIDDAPWAEWSGKGLTSRGLSKLLGEYSIRPRSVRLEDGSTPKGYRREQFEDAWRRYLPANPASIPHNATPRSGTGIEADFDPPQDHLVAAAEEAENPHGDWDVADVADRGAGHGNNGLSTEAPLFERARRPYERGGDGTCCDCGATATGDYARCLPCDMAGSRP